MESRFNKRAPAGAEGEEKRDTRRGFEATCIVHLPLLESRPKKGRVKKNLGPISKKALMIGL